MSSVIDLSNDGMATSIQPPDPKLISAGNYNNIALIVKVVGAVEKERLICQCLTHPINWNGKYFFCFNAYFFLFIFY